MNGILSVLLAKFAVKAELITKIERRDVQQTVEKLQTFDTCLMAYGRHCIYII